MQENIFDNRIYYRTNEFQPGRPTLVFVHGVSGSSSAWLPYEKIFENKYNILTYDIRGHGLSKKYPNYTDYEIKNFAEDLHDLITFLGIKKFVLLGSSFGALITLEYNRLYRETVTANIFTSSAVYVNVGFRAKIFRFILKISNSVIGLFPFDPKPRGHVDYSKHIGSTDWNISRNWADMRNTGLRAHFYALEQSFRPDQTYDLEKINVPTLIIHGEKDSQVPLKNAVKMSKKIKNSKFVSIPNFDHGIHHNAVLEMSKAIEEFIDAQKL
jgi:pimeloyl-ACP methyl ester carboxylesterase